MFYIAIPFAECMRSRAHACQDSSQSKLIPIGENSSQNKGWIKGQS
jgi:hypothetical protein